MNKKVEDYVRSIPDFPEPGIIFRDVTSVIQSPEGLKLAIDGLTDLIGDTEFDVVVEGLYLAFLLHIIPVRDLFL